VNTLYLIRGLPGSGKSTLAKELTPIVFEADQYFINEAGEYNFNPDELSDAHTQCFNNVRDSMIHFREKIAVANTFTMRWELEPYIKLAQLYSYRVVEVTVNGQYQNIHNVPPEVIQRMKERWEN
jgi:predicted kinase